MTTVRCANTDCANNKDFICMLAVVSFDGECEDYQCYMDTADYKKPYWKAYDGGKVSGGVPGKPYKLRAYGKRLIINGIECFTEQDDRENDFIVTLGRTGILVMKNNLENNLSELEQREAEFPDIAEMTEIEQSWDIDSGTYKYRVKADEVADHD